MPLPTSRRWSPADDREQVRELFRGLQATAMELVVGGQRLHGRAVRVDAVVQQGRTQPPQQVALCVVAGNPVLNCRLCRVAPAALRDVGS